MENKLFEGSVWAKHAPNNSEISKLRGKKP